MPGSSHPSLKEQLENNILWVVIGTSLVLALGLLKAWSAVETRAKLAAETYLDSTDAETRIVQRHLPTIVTELKKGDYLAQQIRTSVQTVLDSPEVRESLEGTPSESPSASDVADIVIAQHLPAIANAAIPHGSILVSEKPCGQLPGGWSTYSNGSGRVIIGAGTRTDGRGETRSFESGDKGGEFAHLLTPGEMPSHDHEVNDEGHSHTRNFGKLKHGQVEWIAGTIAVNSGGDAFKTADSKTGITLADSGGNGAHNNMPPYIALHFCSKLGS